jgi:DNA primase
MKFPDSFLEEIRARLPVSQVVARRVTLKRRGREFVGLSPFNKEKSPSFTVNDQKGFYHCFSSGKHGSIFDFVMETEGLSFPEAVERLAGEAGIPLPKPDPQYEYAQKQRLGLYDALEAAARYFEDELKSKEGRGALSYAERRGLLPSTLKEFRFGFAPGDRNALKSMLLGKGFSETQLLDVGVLIRPDDGRESFDRFRNRLIIPILDIKGRVIGFGARTLDDSVQPKYLNSPETSLFDKGSTVFNFARARGPAFDKSELIVVEGYMDVIALHQAGFANAVATLGTAFTERQMELLWQLAPEPIICFDGDRAGEAAAARAIDRMLPTLREGHSFRFAFLPQGSDPDDLVRNEGSAAFAACLSAAIPLIDALWFREVGAQQLDTPERRAALEERFNHLLGTIANNRVANHYRREVKDRLFGLWRGRATQKTKAPGKALAKFDKAPPRPARRATPSPAGFSTTVILALMQHPWLLDRFADEVADLAIIQRPLAELLGALISTVLERPGIRAETLGETLRASRHGKLLDRLERASAFKRLAFLQSDAEPALVEEQFVELLFRWKSLPALRREIDDIALALSDGTAAEFEQFALLQQEVAREGVHHKDDFSQERESQKRLQDTITRQSANVSGRRGRCVQR